MHKKRSLFAFTSQFDMTVTAVSAAAAGVDADDSGIGDDDDRLSSVRVLLSSICFLMTSFSRSVHTSYKDLILHIVLSHVICEYLLIFTDVNPASWLTNYCEKCLL